MSILEERLMKAQNKWSGHEKEDYSIFSTIASMDYIQCITHLINIFTDHINILLVFMSSALPPSAPGLLLSKNHLGAIHLFQFDFSGEQVNDKDDMRTYRRAQ